MSPEIEAPKYRHRQFAKYPRPNPYKEIVSLEQRVEIYVSAWTNETMSVVVVGNFGNTVFGRIGYGYELIEMVGYEIK